MSQGEQSTSQGDQSATTRPDTQTTSSGETTAPGADEVNSAFPTVSLEDHLEGYWDELGMDGERPDVPLVREVDDDEWRVVRADCMTQEGFPPRVNSESAGLNWEVPAEQVDAFDLATYTCEAKYPRRMDYLQPYSPEQLATIYDWFEQETIPCLAAAGYQVGEVPTLEVFRQGYSPQSGFWPPDAGVSGGVPIAVQEGCPHMPPLAVLYGG
ncbi:hypothetical protein [Ornithinimicrobium faecis]|uniref:hypothetical protein n=1 Tax=Ornithinimicrobium faecis TaxID=2934158 RepID=UPI0021182F58|nr:hypothetical protein [Ornithinimicrobium sp. HY1745]